MHLKCQQFVLWINEILEGTHAHEQTHVAAYFHVLSQQRPQKTHNFRMVGCNLAYDVDKCTYIYDIYTRI
jgi:hypothetical protein